jgi:hypothetical protein
MATGIVMPKKKSSNKIIQLPCHSYRVILSIFCFSVF